MISSIILPIGLLLAVEVAHGYTVRATGTVTCYGRALPYTRISLMDEDGLIDKHMGYAVTSASGDFSVSGSASDISFRRSSRRPDVMIRLDLEHSSSKAVLKVTRPVWKERSRSHVLSNREHDVNFGTIDYRTEACHTYVEMYAAMVDFYSRVGYRVPFTVDVRTEFPLHGGTPYAPHRDIHIPPGKLISLLTAKHELAHTVRHHYDGSLSHFLSDTAQYVYTRSHSCDSKTNLGFAFNEGWAEFWAGGCQSGDPNGDLNIEQNVAAALNAMQGTCSTSDHDMWEVLHRSAGSIHSFNSFKHYHHLYYNCS